MTTLRNATLLDMRNLLVQQQARKLDIVAPASALSMIRGKLYVSGVEPQLDDDGVTNVDGAFLCTDVFDEGLSDKLGIPLPYVRKMRRERTDLLDANVNGWLHGTLSELPANFNPDPRSFLVRLFKGETDGVARSIQSDKYKMIDNLDLLTAVLDGIRQAGVDIGPENIQRCDLSDRAMFVKVWAPQIQMLAPELLKGYRSPFSDNEADDNPTVFAGLGFRNSEVGQGAASIWPELTVQVCTNGMTLTKEAVKAVHVGSRMDEGVVSWSEATQRQELKLVTMRARDAARTFLDVDFMKAKVAELTEVATKPIETTTVTVVAKKLSFDKATANGVLDFFVKGGQLTAGGVMQAVTAFAQTVDDPDKAYSLQTTGVRAMELAAGRS